jgi:alcohol oxidase
MKPREQGGVVDDHLNVYGVEGLKVAGTCCLRIESTHFTYETLQI